MVVAYHEAGHAVAAVAMHMKFRYVTIIAELDEGNLGHLFTGQWPRWLMQAIHEDGEDFQSGRVRRYGERSIMGYFAGQLAEAKYRGRKPRYGMHSDNQAAVEMGFRICGTG